MITIDDEASALEAAELMINNKISAIIVINKEKNLIGIVTEHDITRCFTDNHADNSTIPVKNIMTANPETIEPDDSALGALSLMELRQYRHLPVVRDDKIFGVVSLRDLYSVVKKMSDKVIADTQGAIIRSHTE